MYTAYAMIWRFSILLCKCEMKSTIARTTGIYDVIMTLHVLVSANRDTLAPVIRHR